MNEALIQQLKQLKLTGAALALQEQWERATGHDLSFEDRLSLLLDRELLTRSNRRIQRLVQEAKLRHPRATLEEVDHTKRPGLNKAQLLSLGQGHFIRHHHNLLITGATGCGKTYLACALGQEACRLGYRVRYLHLPRALQEMGLAHADGSFSRLMASLQRVDLLILDDFGLVSLSAQQRRDLFYLIEERYQLKSTLICSQLPVAKWHDMIGEPTLADAVLDRLLEHAQRIALEGDSMRQRQTDPS